MRQVEILLAPRLVARVVGDRVRRAGRLHGRVERRPCRRPPACAARIRTGVRSPPPPNHHLEVTTMRVFMCAAGTFGLRGCAISDTPDAQKRGSSSAPGIWLRNSGANSPCTVEVWMPAFSNTRPLQQAHHAAAARRAGVVGARPGLAHEAAGGRSRQRRTRRQVGLHRLERRAQVVAQRLEPGARRRVPGCQVCMRIRSACDIASATSRVHLRAARAPRPLAGRGRAWGRSRNDRCSFTLPELIAVEGSVAHASRSRSIDR